MRTIKKVLSIFILLVFGVANLSMFNYAFAQKSPYDDVLRLTTSGENNESLYSAIHGDGEVLETEKGYKLFNNQVIHIISYIIDIFIVIGIAVAFFGGYKIMTSDKEDTMKEGIRLVVFGILGIIIMVSARFIAQSLVGKPEGVGGIIGSQFAVSDQPNGIVFADDLYTKVMYPFIKVALYFVVGILFFIMAGKVIGFVTSTDDNVKKKAAGIIIWCIVGILIVMGSKQIVEAVMGNQENVLKKEIKGAGGVVIQKAPTRIDEQGDPILEFGSVPLVAQIINWVMGLTMLAIVVLIIIQGYKIFTNPDDPKTREGLKKAILYIIIGILVIGAAYVISNVLVVNNVPIETASASG